MSLSLDSVLPNEILQHIATFLSATDLRSCTSLSEKLSLICSEYSLWKKFFVDLNTISCPPGRLCHTGVSENGKMYIFGGHITQPSSEYFHTVKQDLYECDLRTRTWTDVTLETGPRRTEHTAVMYQGKMIVFGGYSGTGYENSCMVYDSKEKIWSQLPTQGETPSARSAHTAVLVDHTMYVFGGWNGVQCMNDLHALDLNTGSWKLIAPATAASPRSTGQIEICQGEVPAARCSHSAAVVTKPARGNSPTSHVLYIFGGYAIENANDNASKGYLNDLYEFHVESLTWKATKISGVPPSPRSRFRMVSHRDSLYLFAGWNSTKHFSTLHRFSSETSQWTEIATNFDTDGIGQFSMVESGDFLYVFAGYSPNAGCRNNLFAYPLQPAYVFQSP